MAVGSSGKVVINIDPELKREFYAALRRQGKSAKDWFLENAKHYLDTHDQTELAFRKKTEPSS